MYLDDVLEFIELKKDKFLKLCDKFRLPHLWKKEKNRWKLRHTVNLDGSDD